QPVQGRDLTQVEQLEFRDDLALDGQLVEVLDERPRVAEHVVAEVDRAAGQRAGVRRGAQDGEPAGEAVGHRAAGGQLDDEAGALAQRGHRVGEPAGVQGGPGRAAPYGSWVTRT